MLMIQNREGAVTWFSSLQSTSILVAVLPPGSRHRLPCSPPSVSAPSRVHAGVGCAWWALLCTLLFSAAVTGSSLGLPSLVARHGAAVHLSRPRGLGDARLLAGGGIIGTGLLYVWFCTCEILVGPGFLREGVDVDIE